MCDDDWLEVAMSDDFTVAEMLLRLGQAAHKLKKEKTGPALQLEWSVRQRRSRQVPMKTARASPTTPLSWSGATSVSGGGGFEESSRPPSHNPRNKVLAASEITTTTKRSRRRKTLPELKEEESLLLKERRYLKNELTTFRLKLEKQRAENDYLKRRKLEMLPKLETEATTAFVAQNYTISGQPWPKQLGRCPTIVACDNGNHPHSFFLPDLNIPFDDDLGSQVQHSHS